ncbi:hypothetical protein, partial [Staphylococcus aureus]
LLGMFLSLKTLYRKRTVIWPFYFYTIIRTLSKIIHHTGNILMKTGEQISFHDIKHNNVWYIVKIVSKYWCDSD